MNPQKPYFDASSNQAHLSEAPPAYAPPGSYGAPPMSGSPPTGDQKRRHSPQPQAMPAQAHAAPPVYQASPNPLPDGRRLLHVYHEGWSRRHTQVMDSNKVTPIYTINSNSGGIFSSKPHMTLLNASTNAVVGTITFHQISSTIDIEVHGRRITFERAGVFTSAHQFQSLAGGQILKWKRDGIFSGGDLKCIDEREEVVANFENSNWSMRKAGKFEIAPTVAGPFFDEVMVTGIAAMEFQRRQNNE